MPIALTQPSRHQFDIGKNPANITQILHDVYHLQRKKNLSYSGQSINITPPHIIKKPKYAVHLQEGFGSLPIYLSAEYQIHAPYAT